MVHAFLLLQLAATTLSVDDVVEAIAEPGCPRLYGLLTPQFQAAVPKGVWPGFCAQVGRLTDVEPKGERGGMPLYRANSARGPVALKLKIEGEARVAGLAVTAWEEPATLQATELGPLLVEVRALRKVPGLAALAMVDGKVVAHSATGVRKQGDATRVTPDDVWHLGSDTKAMTAVLAAQLVQAGRWKWSTPVSDLFPKLKVHPAFREVTLAMLLRHRAGLPANIADGDWADPPASALDAAAVERLSAVTATLARPPLKVGEFLYSNAGYIVVGAALELATGKTWDVLLRERVFKPLGMRSCSFGVAAHGPAVDQPWPHEWKSGQPSPVFADWKADNRPALGPAGTVSCSLEDWAAFLRLFAGDARKDVVSPEALAELTRPEGNYAAGWGVVTAPGLEVPMLTHAGSNTFNYAVAWVVPSQRLVLVAATNVGDAAAQQATGDVLRFLATTYGRRPQ